MQKSIKAKKMIWVILFGLLLCGQLAVCFYFGNRKSGFHEDEFYSYYSTNKTAGMFVEDRQWMERDQYRDEFIVLDGEGFRYGLVATMQSWDVHPPLYYFLLHTVCSLFPEVFSKWLGIGVNIIAFVINFFLLLYLTRMTAGSLGMGVMPAGRGPAAEPDRGQCISAADKGLALAWLVCGVWGFGSAVVSGVMFIRMYEWLTLFVLLNACIHVKAMKMQKMGFWSFTLPLALTVYMGFLTQYYYIIFHVFIGLGFCVWLYFSFGDGFRSKKGFLACIRYGITCAVGLGAAVISYPACLAHIFRGYRGTEAVSEFGDVSNTLGRLRFFYGLLNEYVFGGMLEWWLLLICLLAVGRRYLAVRRMAGKEKLFSSAFFVLLFAYAGYFFTISKTALLLGETSNRYQLPAYGIVVMLLVMAVFRLGGSILKQMAGKGAGEGSGAEPGWHGKGVIKAGRTVGIILLGAVFLGVDFYGLETGKVFFLYEEEAAMIDYAKENAHACVVVFYDEASPANVWRLSDELMEYDRIYLVSQGNGEPIKDAEISGSDKLVVYVAGHEEDQLWREMIREANHHVGEERLVAEKELWTVYEFGG